jgi:hypothetical protein
MERLYRHSEKTWQGIEKKEVKQEGIEKSPETASVAASGL